MERGEDETGPISRRSRARKCQVLSTQVQKTATLSKPGVYHMKQSNAILHDPAAAYKNQLGIGIALGSVGMWWVGAA